MLAVDPEQFSGGRIQRNHRAPRPRRRVQNAVHHERRTFELVLRPVTEVVRLDAPGDFQVAEVGGVDLVQRPVSSPRKIGGVGRPLRVLRMKLSGCNHRPAQESCKKQEQQNV